jgi:prolyl-tRNA synthetase
LFVPRSFLEKEEEHAEGFAKECAVVTHYRLKAGPDGKGLVVDPNAKLEEELIIRPTSETVIWSAYKNWIKSWRDLPLLINQWANVVRWEMRTRIFLRTAEFLWQEGHTAHATKEEAVEETYKILEIYADFAENWMAMPVVQGVKTASERFAGAVDTFCIEALMQDGKALQSGTSHFLGQNFAKSFDVKFVNKENQLEYPWATSWGVSTRLMGALIMAHSDDNGLVLPPKLAPIQVVIVPIYKTPEDLARISEKVGPIVNALKQAGISVKYDDSDNQRSGWKFAEYELKGVPVRLAIGGRDIENGTVEIARRDTLSKESRAVNFDDPGDLAGAIGKLLEEIQQNIFDKAMRFREENTFLVDTWDEFKEQIEKGGFIMAHWDGTDETEAAIKEETKATVRCIPLVSDEMAGKCVYSGADSPKRVLFARAY